jgi:uncharacterized protein involved in exopolysaccharide biosynthesis
MPLSPRALPESSENWLAPEGLLLVDVLKALARRWWFIALVTAAGTAGAVVYALKATPIYRAQAVIAPAPKERGSGASAALAAFGGIGAEIASNLGIAGGAADANRLEALLKSRRLAFRVITKYSLLPVLFDERWDPAAGRWKVEDPKDVPNLWDAEVRLQKIFDVRNDTKSGLIRLSFDATQAQAAARILGWILEELALVVQGDELKKIQVNRRFVEEQLRKASDPFIVAKLQSLLSEQVEKAMMAQNADRLAYDLIDPPAASDLRVAPKRAAIVSVAFFASACLGAFLVLLADWLRAARATPKGRFARRTGGETHEA